MASHYWLEMLCPMPNPEHPELGGCGKCARHCRCPKREERLKPGPLADLARRFSLEFDLETKVGRQAGA